MLIKDTVEKVPIGLPDFISTNAFHGIIDPDVKKALDEYSGAINRYNEISTNYLPQGQYESDNDYEQRRIKAENEENVAFLSRQVAFFQLELALAKVKLRENKSITLCYDTLLMFSHVFDGRKCVNARSF